MLTRESMLEKLFEFGERVRNGAGHAEMYKCADAILSEIEEPLWELADRKNCWIETHQNRNLTKRIMVYFNQQVTGLDHIDPKEFRGKDYPAAESAARAYLSGLPDVERGGK